MQVATMLMIATRYILFTETIQ